MHRTPINAQLSAARRLVARKDLHQGRLASAVLANQSVDATGLERKTHIVQHPHRPERLNDLVELDADAHRPTPCSFKPT